MAKLSELPGILSGIIAQVTKAKGEIVGKIQALEDALNAAAGDAELSPEVNKALDDLRAVTQTVDDIVPDQTPTPTA